MQATSEVEMSCPRCEERFKFPSEGVGQSATCPHCGEQVQLVDKNVKRAKRIKKMKYSGGAEGWLSFVGGLVFFVGLLGGIAAIVAAFMGRELNIFLCVSGAASILVGFLASALCGGLAEIIRLLKLRNGLEFAGKIDPVSFGVPVLACSNCRSAVSDNAKECHQCGAVFND